MRAVVIGNSGSGKSTLARWLASAFGARHLDLDVIAWEPNQPGVLKQEASAAGELATFCHGAAHWVVEGCYANLAEVALRFNPRLVFLNPGREQCLAHCRSRPWEQHKYKSRAEQDRNLAMLLAWVSDYYTRSGDMSLEAHRQCFDRYQGEKIELTEVPSLAPPSREIVSWFA